MNLFIMDNYIIEKNFNNSIIITFYICVKLLQCKIKIFYYLFFLYISQKVNNIAQKMNDKLFEINKQIFELNFFVL